MATEFHPIPFCEGWSTEGWDKREELEQEKYIAGELRRLESEGAPILRAVMSYGDLWLQHIAYRLLRDGFTADGDPCPSLTTVQLRLVEPERLDWTGPGGEEVQAAAVPPTCDPQGRPLPRDRAGKVLVVKVGNLGGNLDPSRDAKQAQAFGADKRHIMAKAHRTMYLTREVTRDPASYSFADALIILGQWGYGIGETVFAQPRTRDGAHFTRGQCRWLVEEVPREGTKSKRPVGKSSGAVAP
jgi:hypothetical protein